MQRASGRSASSIAPTGPRTGRLSTMWPRSCSRAISFRARPWIIRSGSRPISRRSRSAVAGSCASTSRPASARGRVARRRPPAAALDRRIFRGRVRTTVSRTDLQGHAHPRPIEHPVFGAGRPSLMRMTVLEQLLWQQRTGANVTPLVTAMLPPSAEEGNRGLGHRATGRGRGMGIVVPHFYRNWQIDDLRTLILNGICWTAKMEIPAGGVKSAPPSSPGSVRPQSTRQAEPVRDHAALIPGPRSHAPLRVGTRVTDFQFGVWVEMTMEIGEEVESPGINRHGVADERAALERSSEPSRPRVMRRRP